MKSALKEIDVGDGPAILQMNRKLLSVEQYAEQEGVSKSVIEQCAKVGVVQTRRCKNKTYIVNVPLSPYHYGDEERRGKIVSSAILAEKISELAEKVADHKVDEKIEPKRIKVDRLEGKKKKEKPAEKIADHKVNQKIEPKRIKVDRLEGKKKEEKPAVLSCDPVEVIDDDLTDIFDINGIEVMLEPQNDIVTAPEVSTEQLEKIFIEENKSKDAKLISELMAENEQQYDLLVSKRKAKTGWQVTAVFSIGLFLAAFCGYLWLYVDRAGQIKDLNKAYASVETIYSNFKQSNREVKSLQSELVKSKAERLKTSRALEAAKNDLEAAEYRNSLETQWRNDQLRKITRSLEKR